MSTKREEERNEKIIRGLMKLPPNRKCINCNSMGPQYVCTNFWTFVCMTCSGIHREFTHRVKSVSMAKFTTQEVEALQQGGNQRAREIFLKDWDMQRMRLPDNSNAEKIRQFIKDVYVSKKYSGGNSSNKPPRDTENIKNHEDQRRASSYHSYSQSPPYDYQYEDRRYGKQPGMLSRKPGSDRVHYEGKIPSFIYSPGHVNAEDRFANESSGSRMSDFSVSSTGDAFRYDGFSPNSHDAGYFSPPLNQSRDIMVEESRPQIAHRYPEANTKKDLDGIPRPKRTASSGSFGSSDSNPISHRSVDSVGNIDVILEPVHSSGLQQTVTSVHSNVLPTPIHSTSQDQFALPNAQPPLVSSPSIDLFADFNNQPQSSSLFEQNQPSSVHSASLDLFSLAPTQSPNISSPSLDLFANFGNELSSTSPFEQKPSTLPVPQNEGWATFDLPQHAGVDSIKQGTSAVMLSGNDATRGSVDVSNSLVNNMDGSLVQNFVTPGNLSLASDHWNVPLHEDKRLAGKNNSQLWNAFDDPIGEIPPVSVVAPVSDHKLQVPLPDPFTGQKPLEGSNMDAFQDSTLNVDAVALNVPLDVLAGSSFPSSVKPIVEGNSQVQKSTNPFDDIDLEPSNVFLDMGSLEAALPNSHVTNDYLAGLTQPWYSQNPGGPFMPSFSEGGLQYVAGQGQTPNLEFPSLPQGPVASLGSNPFA